MQIYMPELEAALEDDDPATAAAAVTPADKAINSLLLN
jgi:hypothetical protein